MTKLDIPETGVAKYIADLAKANGVKYVRVPLDDLADVITRLSDDDVASDETEDTIVALRRAGIISGLSVNDLLGAYLDEKNKAQKLVPISKETE